MIKQCETIKMEFSLIEISTRMISIDSLSLSQIQRSAILTVECAANILMAKLQFYNVQSL